MEEHLQRLIFEVYGAEEGIRKLEEINQAEEKRKRSIKALVREAKAAAKAEVRAAKDSAREQERAAQRAADARKKLAEETKRTAQIAGAALALLAKEALQASADMEEVAGQLERTARRNGASQADLAKALEAVDAESRRYGRGMLEQRQLLDNLIDASGSLTQAQYDLALANDIAATGDMELRQASEMLTKARKGEVEELKRLDGITKDQAQALGKITDETERGAKAVAILTANYAGASKELKGTNDNMNNIKEAGKDLLVVVGDTGSGLINAFAQWFGIIEDGESLLGRFGTGLRNFADQAGQVGDILVAQTEYRAAGGTGAIGGEDFMRFLSERDSKAAVDKAANDPNANPNEGVKPLTPARRRGNAGGPTLSPELEKSLQDAEKERADAEKERQRAHQRELEEEAKFLEEQAAMRQRHREEDEAAAKKLAEGARERAEDERKFRTEQALKAAAAEREALKQKVAGKEKEETDLKEIKQVRAETTRSNIEGALQGADALAGVAKSFTKSAGAQLAIESTMAFLRAGVAWATALSPPPLGGPQHIPGAAAQTAAAAAMAAQAAAMGGGGGGKRPAITKGGGSGGKAGRMSDMSGGANSAAPSAREDTAMMNRGMRQGDRAGSVVYQINTVTTPTPQQARQLFDAMESERRNR